MCWLSETNYEDSDVHTSNIRGKISVGKDADCRTFFCLRGCFLILLFPLNPLEYYCYVTFGCWLPLFEYFPWYFSILCRIFSSYCWLLLLINFALEVEGMLVFFSTMLFSCMSNENDLRDAIYVVSSFPGFASK